MLRYKSYVAKVELDPDDELFVGHLAGINDIVGFDADTGEGLKAAFRGTGGLTTSREIAQGIVAMSGQDAPDRH